MHSTIIEIRDHKIEKGMWASESNFYDDSNKLDYCGVSNEEERAEDIRRFLENFNDLFVKGEELDSIVYTGKIADVRKKWMDCIEQGLSVVKSSGKCDTFKLRNAIDRPFEIYTLFCLPDWAGTGAEYPRALFEWIETMKKGDVLYIGNTFDYHI